MFTLWCHCIDSHLLWHRKNTVLLMEWKMAYLIPSNVNMVTMLQLLLCQGEPRNSLLMPQKLSLPGEGNTCFGGKMIEENQENLKRQP